MNLKSDLDKLITNPVDQILADKDLLVLLLRTYSKLFLNDKPCSTCTRLHRAYYIRLVKQGKNQIQKLKIMSKNKAKFKENVVLFHKGQHYSNENINDKVAVQIIKGNELRSKFFEVLPVMDEDPEAEGKKKVKYLKGKQTKINKKLIPLSKAVDDAEKALDDLPDESDKETVNVAKKAVSDSTEAYDAVLKDMDLVTAELTELSK